MINLETLKPFAFGVMAVGLVWAGFAIKGKNDNLVLAQKEIEAARIALQHVSQSLEGVKMDITDTRNYLAIIKTAALTAKNDLSNLEAERNRIHHSINDALDDSRKKLSAQQSSIEAVLAKQREQLVALNASRIDTLIIEPSKKLAQ